jgi:phosphoesterase RecJ-like protein
LDGFNAKRDQFPVSKVATARGVELERVVDVLRDGDRFLLTTHEGPDGDALGSLLALHHILEQLGKDSVMFLAAKEFPLPVEYRFLPLTDVFHEPPADVVDRVLVFLDCGNIERMPVGFLQREGATVLNIDHHHDNTRFGTVDLVDTEASCTAEIVLEISKRLGAEITPEIASALYVALVTDTGMFMYENTGVAAHRMAAELIEAGVDVNDTYHRLYERVPIEKLRLIARALEKIERFDDGRVAVAYIGADDYAATRASEALTEGIIDLVRSLEGTAVAAVIRDKTDGGSSARKVSLRSPDGRVDVSAIARVHGGGGHRRAAGFGTDLPYDELVEFLRAQVRSQLR